MKREMNVNRAERSLDSMLFAHFDESRRMGSFETITIKLLFQWLGLDLDFLLLARGTLEVWGKALSLHVPRPSGRR